MNIATKPQSDRVNNTSKPVETVETAGSLALMPMGEKAAYLAMATYDTFSSSNPFAVDYSSYADCGECSVVESGFLSDFSSAVATIGFDGGFASSGDCGGNAVSSASCGGFSSFC